MSDTHAMRLFRRVIQEHRRAVVLMAAAFVVNVLLYMVVVRPWDQSVATIEQRTLSAEQAKAAAQAEFTRANGTLTGKDRARQELNTFYSKVLAQDLSGARRLTRRARAAPGDARLTARAHRAARTAISVVARDPAAALPPDA